MLVITNIENMVSTIKGLRRQNKSIGFVPTMGALHNGHISLFNRSLSENAITVASIFVNKTQFNDPNDYSGYPRDIEKDKTILNDAGVDIIFLPAHDEIYPDNYNYRVVENSFSNMLCGSSRPGHFEGVLTVVMKLLNIVAPDKAYFGEKDYQQYLLIEQMCKAFFMNTKIILCPTVREKDGLALSSRNLLLSSEERMLAPHFHSTLMLGESADETKNRLKQLGFKVDYVEDVNNRRFAAVFLGKVRLIDNVQL